MSEGLTLRDIWGILRRRFWMIAGVATVCTLLSVLIAFLLPPIYVSSAKILVESQQIPTALASSTVTSSAEERMELIEQRLMTRRNLLDLIDRLDLFRDRPELTPSEKVDAMREATQFERIVLGAENNNSRRNATASAFTLAYRDSSSVRAAKVTNEFVTMVLEQNLKARSERASETHDFFKKEVERLQKDLLELELEIAKFQNQNEDSLPDSLDFRRTELQNLLEQAFDLKRRRIGLEEQRRTLSESLSAGLIGGGVTGRALTPEEQQLQRLKTELSQAQAIYANSHPTVRALRSQIQAVERSIQPRSDQADADAAAEGDHSTQRAKTEAERQIELIDTELELVAEETAQIELRQEDLRASIDKTPGVAMALNALQRKYEDLEAQFKIASAKQAAAATGEKLEVNRKAERFEVIEQAQVPERPESPNRPVIAIGGAAGGLGLALALAMLLEFTNKTIRTAADLERKLQLRPLISIPYIETARERRFRQRKRSFAILLILVVIPASLYAVDQFYLPLDLIGKKMVARLGLSEVVYMVENRLGG